MDKMVSMKYFTSIDLYSGYWQCLIADKDISKTTFLTKYGLYKWVVMPMGLKNAYAMFMQTMKNLFSNMLDYSMMVFLDDFFMYSYMVKEHFTLLEQVLVGLLKHMFYYKL